jgi:hypothetical protein
MRKVGLIPILFGLLFAQAAHAGDPSELFGKWAEKFRNGAQMVTEFTPTSISYYPVDASDKPGTASKPQDVTYRDLGETIAIDFKGGGGIKAMIKDHDSMVLIFPGMGSHTLTRLPQ